MDYSLVEGASGFWTRSPWILVLVFAVLAGLACPPPQKRLLWARLQSYREETAGLQPIPSEKMEKSKISNRSSKPVSWTSKQNETFVLNRISVSLLVRIS